MIFMPDAEIATLLPAPGFPQTLPEGLRWRELLSACRIGVPARGELSLDGDLPESALSIAAECGSVLVLLGGNPDLSKANELVLLLPLLAAAFRGERSAFIAESNEGMARQSADQAKLLAASLDKARAALRKALFDAELANRAKDHFLAALSHELRTPLTPVLLAAMASESDANTPEPIRRDMAMIRRNVELEIHLIDDLLDLSRVIAGKLRLRTSQLNLNTAVQHAIEICRTYIQENGVRLTLDLTPDLASVTADPTRLQQVLWNLLKNAVKFAPQGEVLVRTEMNGTKHARISVSDTGIGIESSALRRIFDAFEQGEAETARKFGGLGLGLAISKAIVELHGGAIHAESEGAGCGAKFTIELPVSEVTVPSPPADPAMDRTSQHLNGHILIVEDHEDTSRLLSRLLTKSGHTVKTANRVDAALELLAREPFDLLLSDVGLPDRPGHDLMRIAADLYQIPGIAMSGYAMDEDIQKCRASGFSENLTKPVNVDQMRQVIQRVLASRR